MSAEYYNSPKPEWIEMERFLRVVEKGWEGGGIPGACITFIKHRKSGSSVSEMELSDGRVYKDLKRPHTWHRDTAFLSVSAEETHKNK